MEIYYLLDLARSIIAKNAAIVPLESNLQPRDSGAAFLTAELQSSCSCRLTSLCNMYMCTKVMQIMRWMVKFRQNLVLIGTENIYYRVSAPLLDI